MCYEYDDWYQLEAAAERLRRSKEAEKRSEQPAQPVPAQTSEIDKKAEQPVPA